MLIEEIFLPEKTTVVDTTLAKRYGFLSDSSWPEENPHTLIERIKDEAKKLKRNIINTIPPSQDQTVLDFEPIPQYQFPTWPELERNFELYGIANNGVLLAAPSVWQYVYPFQHMIRKYKLFLARNDMTNIPLCAEIIRQAETSCLVTHDEAAILLQAELKRRGIDNILKLVVIARDVRSTLGQGAKYNFGNATVFFDLQVFPGHTIAYQTFGSPNDPDCFHLSDRYLWRLTNEGTYITGLQESVLPLFNYRLPVVLERVNSNTKLPAFRFNYV